MCLSTAMDYEYCFALLCLPLEINQFVWVFMSLQRLIYRCHFYVCFLYDLRFVAINVVINNIKLKSKYKCKGMHCFVIIARIFLIKM